MAHNAPCRHKKIHIKHLSWLMPLFLSGIMSGILSCVNLALQHRADQFSSFISLWFSAWGISWLVAYPCILIFLPLVRRFLTFFMYTSQD
ncbi:DUF2798 domain-containing protein [Acinetobacter rathckeae]|uniref:DUF2798 domain-containing protein n=1 Tax=Acinetobacter rathckeae TaxID=2605272 RepID=UPI0018A2D0D7|nr:DUF2798 domain-containing protein [Acinetobacter rathckeae]MBF7688325.1 DUF2798 domain-containing protein [Acinetobacter rathckeae]MBF7695156.1 DUF2798 domain-containing protein [Acinetobacter rathckeae]